jgi:hypothetical protein
MSQGTVTPVKAAGIKRRSDQPTDHSATSDSCDAVTPKRVRRCLAPSSSVSTPSPATRAPTSIQVSINMCVPVTRARLTIASEVAFFHAVHREPKVTMQMLMISQTRWKVVYPGKGIEAMCVVAPFCRGAFELRKGPASITVHHSPPNSPSPQPPRTILGDRHGVYVMKSISYGPIEYVLPESSERHGRSDANIELVAHGQTGATNHDDFYQALKMYMCM